MLGGTGNCVISGDDNSVISASSYRAVITELGCFVKPSLMVVSPPRDLRPQGPAKRTISVRGRGGSELAGVNARDFFFFFGFWLKLNGKK